MMRYTTPHLLYLLYFFTIYIPLTCSSRTEVLFCRACVRHDICYDLAVLADITTMPKTVISVVTKFSG